MGFREYIVLTRPINSSMTGIGIVFAVLVYSGWNPDPFHLFIGFLTGYFGSAAAMVVNDVVDYSVDRVNKPWKPIPAGKVDVVRAKYFSIVLLLLTIIVNISMGSIVLVVVAIYSLTAYIYSFLRKHWWSQLIVPFSTTSPIIYGYVLTGMPRQYLSLAVMFSITIYLASLGREIVKAIQDREGDNKYGYVTIPLKYGLEASRKTILLTGILSSITAYLTGLLGETSILYYILITITVAIYLYHVVKIYGSIDDKTLLEKTRKNMLKAMMIGLIAFLLSKTP